MTAVAPEQGEVRWLLGDAFYRMAYTAFGDAAAPPVVCVHGLTRTGRDFDALASALADRFRVICPDLPGRGASEWLPDATLYQPPTYVQALAHLLASIGRPVAWVGTSLGGICGMLVAAACGTPLTRLVLNDIGPSIPAAALRRLRAYVGRVMTFPDLAALEAHLRLVHAGFGPLSDAHWRHLAETSARRVGGRVTLHYDPGIARSLRGPIVRNVEFWPVWERIAMPVLVLRGTESDLLLPATLSRMERGGARSMLVPETGHAPALMDEATIAAIRGFLEEGHAGG